MSIDKSLVLKEQDALIAKYRKMILDRFGVDIITEFDNDLYEWTEDNFRDYIDESLQFEQNERLGL